MSDLGLEPRTVGRKATAFAIGFLRQGPVGGCEENGVPWEKVFIPWEAPQQSGCPQTGFPKPGAL